MTTRRRFLTILAGAAVLPALGQAATARWHGIALGANAQIILEHPNADTLLAQALAEINRLEGLFSLHQASQLTTLNRDGRLESPAAELLELLSLCSSLHARTAGAFDPTIQPLWALYAESYAAGNTPTDAEISATLAQTGWQHVRFSPGLVALTKPNMQLTFNGVAQGFIADKVAALLRANGVENVLVDTGEIVAAGLAPGGAAWPVRLAGSGGQTLPISNAAIATSALLGTTFDTGGSVGHILDPRTGRPGGLWPQIRVVASSAAEADGLSTAFCLMDKASIAAARNPSVYDVMFS